MATFSTDATTSFRQYQYCDLCKRSHTRGKKHIYSKYHQMILKKILTKFANKIQLAKKNLFCPEVRDELYEKDAMFWCYFCRKEFEKHNVVENCTVLEAGVLQHIASKEHESNMQQFFWDNLIKKGTKMHYILSEEDLYIFNKAAFLSVKKWQKANDVVRMQIVEDIRSSELKRKSDAHGPTDKSLASSASLANTVGDGKHATSSSDTSEQSHTHDHHQQGCGKKTTSVFVKGLACVTQRTSSDDTEGNVHSGATPPWLQPDTQENPEIGPTFHEYKKHLEREKKAKLPSQRVGAKFDHCTPASHDWMPSFGGVWSKGRRSQSKIYNSKQIQERGTEKRQIQTRRPQISLQTFPNPHSVTNVMLSSSIQDTYADGQELNHQMQLIGNSNNCGYKRKEQVYGADKCIPYKRHRFDTHEKTMFSSGDSTHSYMNEHLLTNGNLPYKRIRDDTKEFQKPELLLIPTPILTSEQM